MIGSGVGGGVLIDGRALAGPLDVLRRDRPRRGRPGGRQCSCGNRGCLETFLSAPALRLLDNDEARRDVGLKLATVLTPVVTTLGIADVVLYGPTELLEGALLDSVRGASRPTDPSFRRPAGPGAPGSDARRARTHGRGGVGALPRARGGVTCFDN